MPNLDRVQSQRLTDEDRLHLFSVIDEHSANGIWVVDRDGTTIWTNRVGRGLYNLSVDQTVGVPISEFERRGIFRPAASLIALREHAPVTVIHETACGRVTLASANPLVDDAGKISLVIVGVTDISNLDRPGTGETPPARRAKRLFPSAAVKPGEMAYRSAAMRQVMAAAERVAASDCAVLISGETGVGKTEIARLVHSLSPRRNGKFVAVDCGALPASLIEAELFGYVAGAFTGSSRRDKIGLVQMAAGGTLFLDEIGELPVELQVKLLRVLDEKRVRPVGDVSDQSVDFRLIAASNQDLLRMTETGRFRPDLYYRIAIVTIDIPPLRDRPDDILPIADSHLKIAQDRYRRTMSFSADALRILQSYSWPGNARELRNLIEGLVVMSPHPVVGASDLPPYLRPLECRTSGNSSADASDQVPKLRDAVRTFERELVLRAIDQTSSHAAAAQLLGVSLPTLMRKKRARSIKSDCDNQN